MAAGRAFDGWPGSPGDFNAKARRRHNAKVSAENGEEFAVRFPCQRPTAPQPPLAGNHQPLTADFNEQGARAPDRMHITTFLWEYNIYFSLASTAEYGIRSKKGGRTGGGNEPRTRLREGFRGRLGSGGQVGGQVNADGRGFLASPGSTVLSNCVCESISTNSVREFGK